MSIKKLTEFASKTDAKNTDGIILESGFPSKEKPARQWFNWLFNSLTVKVNEIIDALGNTTENLATLKKELSVSIDKKLDATANAVSASKLQNARKISLTGALLGGGDFDGQNNISINTTLEGFGNSKSENGHTYLGNGLILQWGAVEVLGYSSSTFNFPIRFPNRLLNIQVSGTIIGVSDDQATIEQTLTLSDITASSVLVRNLWTGDRDGARQTQKAFIFAIGF